MHMAISSYPSTVLMPKMEKPYPLIVDFLTQRFPGIDADIWKRRIQSGKVLTEEGKTICLDMPCTPLKRLHYFREVLKEEIIPFTETIVFCNRELLVACKPHFLPCDTGGAIRKPVPASSVKRKNRQPASFPHQQNRSGNRRPGPFFHEPENQGPLPGTVHAGQGGQNLPSGDPVPPCS